MSEPLKLQLDSLNSDKTYSILATQLKLKLGLFAYQYLRKLEQQGIIGCVNYRTEDLMECENGVLSMRFFDRLLVIAMAGMNSNIQMIRLDFGDWRAVEYNLQQSGKTFSDLGYEVSQDNGYSKYISCVPYSPKAFELTRDGRMVAGSVEMESPHSIEFARTLSRLLKLIHPLTQIILSPNTEAKYQAYSRLIQKLKINEFRSERAAQMGLAEAAEIYLMPYDPHKLNIIFEP
jgi:hypothetical protein